MEKEGEKAEPEETPMQGMKEDRHFIVDSKNEQEKIQPRKAQSLKRQFQDKINLWSTEHISIRYI